MFIPLLGKLAGAFISIYVARLDTPLVLTAGLMAKGVAEIALLIILYETGVIGHDVFSLLVLIMLGYILLTPQVIGLVISRAKASDPPEHPGVVPPVFARHALHGVMVGRRHGPDARLSRFGVVGSELLRQLTLPNQYDYLVVDEAFP